MERATHCTNEFCASVAQKAPEEISEEYSADAKRHRRNSLMKDHASSMNDFWRMVVQPACRNLPSPCSDCPNRSS